MRQHLIALAVAVGFAPPAFAQPAAKQPAPKKAVVKDRDKLVVYKDDIGKYYVVPRPDLHVVGLESMVFFGDGKRFYRQSIIGYGSQSRPEWQAEWTLWSPRVKERAHATIYLTAKELFVQCQSREKRPLTQLSADQGRKVIASAQFFEPFWQRESRFLARDDDGTYFFVDRLRDEAGGGGYRIFVGKKGTMKQLPMTNLVNDSAGDIYATRSGELKFITENGKAFWKKGNRRTELVVLPPAANRYLIYRELGIYGQLGVVCEDM